jgi:hypothetical protein
MAKKPMPNQGIGTASSKSNLKGKRKLRSRTQEDMPGWNWRTMGNKKRGPVPGRAGKGPGIMFPAKGK